MASVCSTLVRFACRVGGRDSCRLCVSARSACRPGQDDTGARGSAALRVPPGGDQRQRRAHRGHAARARRGRGSDDGRARRAAAQLRGHRRDRRRDRRAARRARRTIPPAQLSGATLRGAVGPKRLTALSRSATARFRREPGAGAVRRCATRRASGLSLIRPEGTAPLPRRRRGGARRHQRADPAGARRGPPRRAARRRWRSQRRRHAGRRRRRRQRQRRGGRPGRGRRAAGAIRCLGEECQLLPASVLLAHAGDFQAHRRDAWLRSRTIPLAGRAGNEEGSPGGLRLVRQPRSRLLSSAATLRQHMQAGAAMQPDLPSQHPRGTQAARRRRGGGAAAAPRRSRCSGPSSPSATTCTRPRCARCARSRAWSSSGRPRCARRAARAPFTFAYTEGIANR